MFALVRGVLTRDVHTAQELREIVELDVQTRHRLHQVRIFHVMLNLPSDAQAIYHRSTA